MSTRAPAVLCAVGAAHAALLWCLWANTPPQPPRVATSAPASDAVLRVVLLQPGGPAPVPARQPTAPARPAWPAPEAKVVEAAADDAAAATAAPSAVLAAAPSTSISTATAATSIAASAVTAAVVARAAPAASPPNPPVVAATPGTVAARADHRLCNPAAHPAALRERGIEGTVGLRVKVTAQGLPADVQLVAASGWRLFDEAALQQARGCRFYPAMQGGQPVDSWVEFPVRFSLAG